MSSVKIKKIKFFFEDADCVFFAGKYPRTWGACAFYALYILFISLQFISFQFYSIQRDEKNETLRMITKKTKITNDNENNENNEILRKKGKLRNITKKRKYFKKK